MAWACVQRGKPIAAISFHKNPAPRPSSNLPPDRRSMLAADFATMAGERIAMLRTFGAT